MERYFIVLKMNRKNITSIFWTAKFLCCEFFKSDSELRMGRYVLGNEYRLPLLYHRNKNRLFDEVVEKEIVGK